MDGQALAAIEQAHAFWPVKFVAGQGEHVDILGLELKVENMEFDSIIAAVQSGKADVGVAGMTVTPDREENVSFTQGYATSKQVIIVRKD